MESDGYRAMKRLLTVRPRIDAVFAVNDPAAIGAMKAIWEAGLRVPDDIAVVGVGDIALGDLLKVPLTTVGWSRKDQGLERRRAAAERSRQRRKGPAAPRHHSAAAGRARIVRSVRTMRKLIVAALPLMVAFAAAQAQTPPRKRLLALGDTHTGYTHDSIGHALAVIDHLGRQSGAVRHVHPHRLAVDHEAADPDAGAETRKT